MLMFFVSVHSAKATASISGAHNKGFNVYE